VGCATSMLGIPAVRGREVWCSIVVVGWLGLVVEGEVMLWDCIGM